jgi:hypothetical protein
MVTNSEKAALDSLRKQQTADENSADAKIVRV